MMTMIEIYPSVNVTFRRLLRSAVVQVKVTPLPSNREIHQPFTKVLLIYREPSEFNLLPPASEGWGKVIFSVCPHLREEGGYPVPGLWVGGGYPIPGLGGEVPHPRSRWRGGYPIPDQDGGGGSTSPLPSTTRTGWGTPPPTH